MFIKFWTIVNSFVSELCSGSDLKLVLLSSLKLADDVPEVVDPKESSSSSQALVTLLGWRDVDLKRVTNLLEVKLDRVNTLEKKKLYMFLYFVFGFIHLLDPVVLLHVPPVLPDQWEERIRSVDQWEESITWPSCGTASASACPPRPGRDTPAASAWSRRSWEK